MSLQAGLKAIKTIATVAATAGLAAIFMMAASDDASAKTRHPVVHHQQQHHQKHHQKHPVQVHHKKHHQAANDEAQPTHQRNTLGNTFKSASDTLIYHVRTGKLELGGRTYDAGSGNREGFNNPAYEHVVKRGPVPQGTFSISERGQFHGHESWNINGTPGRTHILIHPDSVRLIDHRTKKGVVYRPDKESLGCIAVESDQYQLFKREMHRLNPSRIIVKPG